MTEPTTGMDPNIRLGASNVTRRFGSVVANDGVDFKAERGTVHAIVGGNGAGKSTLMRILQGMDRPDEGFVLVDGVPTVFLGPADAFDRGIGMVHQEFMLVPGLTLLENLVLAKEPTDKLGRIDHRAALEAAHHLEKLAGVTLDWNVLEQDAPVHVRQIVEILRLLYRGADVLILDEPTAVLAPAQVNELIALLRKLRSEGRTIIFISHKLDEVLAVADRITVMRNGRAIGSLERQQASKARLAEMMIGEVVARLELREQKAGAEVLSIEHLDVAGRRQVKLKDFSLAIRSGEIVGIAGVAGNGQDEITGAVTGLIEAESGRIRIGGVDITDASLSVRRAAGLSYLSPDRAAEGLCLQASITDNAIAGHHRASRFCAVGVTRLGAINRHIENLLDRFAVKRGSSALPASSLSGGNQQKVAVARELDGDPKALIACQPTRGVDIRGIAFIHQCLLDYRDRGGAVLLISEELDELLELADRIVVIYGGEVTGEVGRGASDVAEIGRMMLGGKVAA
ncbi:MAG: ABC transporter ATP-binding protein [Rhizobiaceae bacterium]